MESVILKTLEESIEVKRCFFEDNVDRILAAAKQVATCFASGHKLLIFGNGGSAADAQHIAAEFVNRFTVERRPLPAVALNTDTSVLTSISNDYSFDEVFSKQIRALGVRDDIALGISTSGNSKNVLIAMETGRQMGLYTMGLTGCGGGKLGDNCDLSLAVDSNETPRIQETHITVGHIVCDLVDRILFPELYEK
ncbi:MAG: D-sedoheptulose 7-phosphate isomerase [Deltaproteobacteria bacterium]|nr:D-sedoheptulose 7-phosphate isomerase [Deltaproteobacteria bacterium]MBW2318682.1 D-sedoheptulose 7-phosphate isomerase [Deltaproteobacteria bacterium]MBW2600662.1 D-sedoheptulose 7-phosphate isomerase [Deltaproteobacteria bacterium]OEU45868.1 MAG: phosphoheptose isomerase [Desulfobacterales bacterium S7086C20]